MTLGYYDVAAPHITRILPRQPAESRMAYVRRFFGEIRGLGAVRLVLVRGDRRRVIAGRSL